MQVEPLETLEGQGTPTVRQHSVFIENRVGQLLRLTQLFERTETRIVAVSVVHSVDCAICRMIADDPDDSYRILTQAGFHVSESELLVVSLPHGRRALLSVWAALLGGEVNIHYTYPLLIQPHKNPAIAICADNVDQAAKVLAEHKIELLDEQDLLRCRLE